MNTFSFNKNFATRTISIDCKFKVPLNIVWDAFTNAKTMEKWFAPKPYKAISKEAKFITGGHWLYYMLSPEGEKYWSITNYQKIEPLKSFEATDAFCDENGTINTEFPQLHWQHNFSEKNGQTGVIITITMATDADMQKILEMGFEEGYKMGLTQLLEILNDRLTK